jgi:cell division protein FtsB
LYHREEEEKLNRETEKLDLEEARLEREIQELQTEVCSSVYFVAFVNKEIISVLWHGM